VQPPRALVLTVLMVLVLALQTTVLPRLGLPGATPDLVLLLVVSLALADGPVTGMWTGFAAGLTLDLVPPADHAVGRYALVLTLVGYLAGLLQDELDRSAVLPFLVVAAAAAGGTALYAGLGALFSEVGVDGGTLLGLLPTAVLYDVLLAPFVVPFVIKLARRNEPDLVRW
jgi:rod shape-determining protein MreD